MTESLHHLDPAPAGEGRPPGAARPCYFGGPEWGLFGWFHGAKGPVRRSCAVVLCGPLGSETTGSPRAMRHWAERLASAGFSTLRFDYHGLGDSSGHDDDPSRVEAWMGSVGQAIEFVRASSGVQRVVLCGLRFGGTLALASAIDRGDVDGLVLWGAFPSGRAMLREGRAFTRLMATPESDVPVTDKVEQLGGLAIAPETATDLGALNPLHGDASFSGRVLVIPRDEGAADATFVAQLAKAGAQVERQVVFGYADVMVDAHKSAVPEAVISASISWLESHYPPREQATKRTPSRGFGVHTTAISFEGRAPSAPGMPVNRVQESAVHFGGLGRLFGVLARPERVAVRTTGILLVNSGAVNRAGPNRLYASLAREWASLGYTTLRMDVGGLGDSLAPAGAAENHTYPSHAVGDIAEGIALLRRQGVERIVVGGLCSGAHASFHAALQLSDVDGLLLLNPIVFYWKPSDSLDVSSWANYSDVRHYKRSILEARSWMRLFTGKVNVLYVQQVAAARLREVVRARRTTLARRFGAPRLETENAAHDLGQLASTGTDVLLLFSAGDPGHDFLAMNYARELRVLSELSSFRIALLPAADHTFTALDARRRAAVALTQHLLARHP